MIAEGHGEVIADLRCIGRVESELGPEWFERVGVPATDQAEFYLPGT